MPFYKKKISKPWARTLKSRIFFYFFLFQFNSLIGNRISVFEINSTRIFQLIISMSRTSTPCFEIACKLTNVLVLYSLIINFGAWVIRNVIIKIK